MHAIYSCWTSWLEWRHIGHGTGVCLLHFNIERRCRAYANDSVYSDFFDVPKKNINTIWVECIWLSARRQHHKMHLLMMIQLWPSSSITIHKIQHNYVSLCVVMPSAKWNSGSRCPVRTTPHHQTRARDEKWWWQHAVVRHTTRHCSQYHLHYSFNEINIPQQCPSVVPLRRWGQAHWHLAACDVVIVVVRVAPGTAAYAGHSSLVSIW